MSKYIHKANTIRRQETAKNWQIVLTFSALIGSFGLVTHYL